MVNTPTMAGTTVSIKARSRGQGLPVGLTNYTPVELFVSYVHASMMNNSEDSAHWMESTWIENEQTALTCHTQNGEAIEDVGNVFPLRQMLPEGKATRGISIRLPFRTLENSSEDTHDELGLPALPDVMEIYRAYVSNELPAHLVYLPEKRLVSRQEMNEMFHRDMLAVTEADINKVMKGAAGCSVPTRKEAVKAIVQRKLKYGIFSHKWIERGEPTFQDLMMSLRPAGYGKLMNFCERAAKYGCRLAWSDTCCINKESSAEVEEAIQSMFRWYRNAHVCIAHLDDATSVDDLWKDVWFTRGWILQELLAPRTIKFYGKDWVPLSNSVNDKQDLRMLNALSQATGISHHDLCHFRPGTRDVHKKMMWASNRTTTRVEDTAYCLTGIFDVSLTIAYGEGRRAFYRLMEKIVNRCEEWEVMAWAGEPSTGCAALPDSPRCYKVFDEAAASNGGSQWEWRGDRHFAVTKRGLQLKLLIVDLPSSSVKLFEGTKKDAECTRYGKCTVGVIDYWCFDTSGQGLLRPGRDHLCWLLRSDPFDPSSKWEKVSTTELLFIRTDIEVKKDLSTLWL